jgi:hypothetical protein
LVSLRATLPMSAAQQLQAPAPDLPVAQMLRQRLE